ncbi:GGDEF domain-containing protein [Shewanella sp. 10N.286.48.A6]|uniref:tetratricopeptide repeat-containing diguanylate cyclase n=1 Tax=Shewanella sp. 10N.286.48.A6 TaxID=1880833 RepID=UPI0012FFE9D7|nr:GGDEF domain-containing protein [Shewanella sp. 10N.286.48.A6]
MKKFVFIFALFISTSLNANYIDDLLVKADNLRSSHPETFQTILSELEQAQLSQQQQGHYHYLLAYQKSFKGDFKGAIALYTDIVDNDQTSTSIRFRATISLVNIYAISKDWNQGLKHLLISQSLLPDIVDNENKQRGLLINAIFYNQIGQYELGEEYASKLSDYVTKGRNHCMAAQLSLEAKSKLNLIEYDSPLFNDGIESCEQAQEPVVLSGIYTSKASLLIKTNLHQQALALLLQHQSMIEQTQYTPILSYFYSFLAQAYFGLGENQQAKEMALKTLAYTETLGSSEPEVIANKILYSLAEQANNPIEALKYYQQFAEADKAYLNDIKAKHLAFQLAKHRAAEQQNNIEFLRQQNNLLLLKQKIDTVESENNRLFIALLILCVTVLLGMIFRTKSTQKKLRHLAQNDGLTGLFNRRYFTQKAIVAIARCNNLKQSGSCILFDLDRFKNINDSYGHKTGDWVLKMVASECKEIVRNKDIFARVGGEEFCLFLPNCSISDALVIAETYRAKLNAIITDETGFNFEISGSFGVSDFSTSGTSLDKLIADADHAMYQAKKSGRNKVCASTETYAD